MTRLKLHLVDRADFHKYYEVASGMFVPVADLPDFIQKISHYLPTYHYAQLAYAPLHHADEPLGSALAWSAVWAVILFGLAVRAYRRDQGRKFS